MAIEKNQIPILEYDNSSKEVINPQHEDFKIVIPNKLVFSFCGENVKKFALKNLFRCKKIAQFVTSSGNFPVYKLKIKNQEIGLCMAPTGAAGATQFLDWLIAYGAKEIVGVGSCGCLIEDCEGDLFVPDRALRDEGTSYHYLP
ncbi:MAG: phosphorylase, partial [Clostridia bacterium]